MRNHPMVLAADSLAARAHAGQVDRAGVDYISHPRAVAWALVPFGPEMVAGGLLHDVVEDCGVTAKDLRDAGMSENVVTMVFGVSKRPGVTYLDMIRGIAVSTDLLDLSICLRLGLRIRPSRTALLKVADNGHNSRGDRHKVLETDTSSGLLRRYSRSRVILLPAVGAEAARIVYQRVNPALLAEIPR